MTSTASFRASIIYSERRHLLESILYVQHFDFSVLLIQLKPAGRLFCNVSTFVYSIKKYVTQEHILFEGTANLTLLWMQKGYIKTRNHYIIQCQCKNNNRYIFNILFSYTKQTSELISFWTNFDYVNWQCVSYQDTQNYRVCKIWI